MRPATLVAQLKLKREIASWGADAGKQSSSAPTAAPAASKSRLEQLKEKVSGAAESRDSASLYQPISN